MPSGQMGRVHSSIMRGNNLRQVGDFRVSVDRSCVQRISPGCRTLATPPRLVDPDEPDDDLQTCEATDCRLSPDSLCVDAGRNQDCMCDPLNFDGNVWVLFGKKSLTVAMGAYEHGFGVVWHVDASVGESGEGCRPTSTFQTIREGVETAWNCGMVSVAEGIYTESIHFNEKNIALYGGHAMNRSVVVNAIIDGYQAGQVVAFSGTEEHTCILSGFSIRNGKRTYAGGICGDKREVHTRDDRAVRHPLQLSRWREGLRYCDGTVGNKAI